MKKHRYDLLICCALLPGIFIMCGCSEPKNMNRIESIVLSDGEATATLELPATYTVKKFSSSGAQFDCQYPSMRPTVDKAAVSDMTVNILLGHLRKNLADLINEEAKSDHFDPNRPGAAYRNGKNGEYQVFLRGDPVSDPKGFNTYYLFKAKDGQWVQVEWSAWSEIYTAERQIDSDISIKYWFLKSKGADFIHIDGVVLGFVKEHLKIQSIHDKGGW